MTVVLGLYGYSNTGKTTVIEYLIKELTDRGIKVAAVKTTDKPMSMDTEGKDTWRYAQKGAETIVLSSPVETSYLIKHGEKLQTIINQINHLNNVDVVLVEGVRDLEIQKIRFGDAPLRKNTFSTYDGNNKKILDFILDRIKEEKHVEESVQLKVNGKRIPLSGFPREFIKQTIAGMVKSLKGVDRDVKEVEIYFKME